jgi:hypothetical protein
MAESGLDSGMESRATVQGCTDCGFDPVGEAERAHTETLAQVTEGINLLTHPREP